MFNSVFIFLKGRIILRHLVEKQLYETFYLIIKITKKKMCHSSNKVSKMKEKKPRHKTITSCRLPFQEKRYNICLWK